MITIAYLANEFPSAVEPYVVDEIAELQRHGACVLPGSVRRSRTVAPATKAELKVVLQPLPFIVLLRALWLCVRKWSCIAQLLGRILLRGSERPSRRFKALVHTFLGAGYAVLLQGRGIEHIHVHHGYFGSWIGMTAARLLGVGFSLTLHGSDLLLHGTYLDVKLAACSFCLTVSEYNRDYILANYPRVEKGKILVTRMGVEVPDKFISRPTRQSNGERPLNLLAVGRLHAVKDHAFLINACSRLAARDRTFQCSIAGDGPERIRLQSLIAELGLGDRVTLLGHIGRRQMATLYDGADVVVLTSRSEGIPLVLMEAMARGRVVLAPAITGIPELVIAGKTGFLYEPGSLNDFVAQLLSICSLLEAESNFVRDRREGYGGNRLKWIRHAARVQVGHNFNRTKNLELFCDMFLERLALQSGSIPNESFVLQQI